MNSYFKRRNACVASCILVLASITVLPHAIAASSLPQRLVPLSGTVNVMNFGAVGDCVADDTAAIQAALPVSNTVTLPKPPVCYRVASITVAANKTILTDGMATVIKQIAGQPVGTRTIRITGSNVRIGSFQIYGNIETDTDEQQHAVFIQANQIVGNIENIVLADISGHNIRGDVLYIGQTPGYSVRNVKVSNVAGDNVYRNIVTFISGDGLAIKSITGTRVGFTHFDAEPNIGSGSATNINIEYIKGRSVGLIGQTTTDFVDMVNIGTIDIDPAYASQSAPPYPPGTKIDDGLILRNLKNANIGKFLAKGFKRSALFTVTNAGELGVENIVINHASVRDCALNDNVYRSYFHLNATNLSLNSMTVDIDGDRSVFGGGSIGGKIINATAHLGIGSTFISSSKRFLISDSQFTGGGTLIKGGGSHTIVRSVISGSQLSVSATPSTFIGVTAILQDRLFDGNGDEHVVRNSTLKVKH